MAKGRKRKDSADEDVEAYRHENEIRKNVVPAGLAYYDTSKSKPKQYEYDPYLDPQQRFKKWEFIEITDPWNVKNTIREFLQRL
jgi:hypothetical protein